MKRALLLAVTFLSFVATPTLVYSWPSIPKIKAPKLPGREAGLDKKNKELVDSGNASLDEIEFNEAYLKEVKPEELEAVKEHLSFVSSKINSANVFKLMDYKFKNHSEANKLRKRIEEKTAYRDEVKANYKATLEKVEAEQAALEASRKRLRDAARAFRENYNAYAMKQFIPFLTDEGAKAFDGRLTVQLYNESDAAKHKEAAAKLLAACNQESFSHRDIVHQTADVMAFEEELVKACEVAKDITSVLSRVYLYELAKTDVRVVKDIDETIEAAQKDKGWMDARHAINVLRILNGGAWPVNVNMNWITERDRDVVDMCKAIGIPLLENPFPARGAAYQKLAETVREHVKTWGRWPKDGKFKVAAAHKALRNTIEKPEKVIKVGMSSSSWSIKKNPITGIPLSRSKMGYSITRVKGDALCRLREFRYTETYAGGGRYQKSTAVGFNQGVRLVRCK